MDAALKNLEDKFILDHGYSLSGHSPRAARSSVVDWFWLTGRYTHFRSILDIIQAGAIAVSGCLLCGFDTLLQVAGAYANLCPHLVCG